MKFSWTANPGFQVSRKLKIISNRGAMSGPELHQKKLPEDSSGCNSHKRPTSRGRSSLSPCLKVSSRDTLPTKICLVKAIVFSSSHVWMWELDYKESWAPKNWCFWTVVLVKTLESPLDCKEILPVHPKGNQSLLFIGKVDVEAESPIPCPPDVKSWLIGKDSDAGKDWRQEEKGATEGEMVAWHHQLNGHEVE